MDNWPRIEELFLQALHLPLAERPGFLRSACAGDAGLLREVEEMLEADASGTHGVFGSSIRQALSSYDVGDLEGREIGVYRVVREIGRGGMGAVFLAVRADDEFDKQVAIKIIKRGMDSVELLRRFRHERQILAQLDHPYIARLIDGGTLPDGRPYFVMDFVDGKPIDQFCVERQLSVEQRARLFCKVCEAVAYAHRNLVVHRDLKPGNILVSPDGSPHLLDFGIAKLLGPGVSGEAMIETAMHTRLLTPEYASPEQVRGLPVTTASDVYLLGAILFELLTGKRAHRLTTYTPEEVSRVVCETEPGRPSQQAAAGLDGDLDLDNIMLMAMRKEPERRYASANELRQDIERHFAGQPVLARGNPFGYVAGKFLRRHAGAAIAATLALVSILAGSVVALREAHVATKASARAENRLHDLVQLANNTLFEVEDDLARQPGATKTRQKIVKSTLDYLDKLAADESGDRELSLALAAGYLKMGDVLGRPHKPNLGDPKGAVASYRMAEKVLAPLRAQGDTLDSAVMRVEIEDRIGGVQFETGTLAEAQKTTEPLLKEIESLVALHPNDKAVLLEQASIYDSMLDIEAIRSYSGAIDWARKSIALYERVAKLDPADEVALEDLAVGYSNAALALGASPDRQMVTGYVRKSLDIREERVRRHPEDAIARRDLMVIMGRMGDVILGLPDDRTPAVETEALLWYWRAADVARELMRADPSNVNARDDYAAVVARAGVLMPHDIGAIRESLERLREGEQLLRQSLHEKPNERLNVIFLCNCYDGEGQRLEVLGRLPEALATADEAYRAASALVVREPNFAAARNRTMMSFKLRIRVLARLGRSEESAGAAREAMRLGFDYAAHGPMPERMVLFRPQVWEWLGEANGILHDSVNSRAAYVRARDEWKLLAATNAAANVPKNIARVEALIAKLP